MSRCFPYPPPGYSLPIRGGDDKRALIESIKLQKDKEKPKEERRKERKKEKNDKKEKKDKKRKRKVHSNETLDGNGEGKLKKVKTEIFEKQQISSLTGKCDESHVDAESSDLTEEHDQPVCVPKPSYSSENSQNSDKRRRLESAANSIKADGSILKIRLSSFKKKEPNSTSNNDVGPSTSGRTEPIGRNNFEFGQKLVKKDPPTTSISTGIRVPCSTPLEKQPSLRFIDLAEVPNPVVAVSKTSTCKESKSASKESKSAIKESKSTSKEPKPTSKLSKAELLYKNLLESWALPAQGSEVYDDDGQDWLFQKKSNRIEKSEATSNPPCSLEENLWPPRAQFLPSVDVYALPYTVPF